MTPPYTLSVGVDFGVSTSGVSYCLRRPNESTWSSCSVTFGSNRKSMEPSVLGNTDRPGSWGSGITEDEDKLTLFKLSLLHPDDLRQINEQHPERIAAVRDAFSKLDTAGKRGVDVVAEYLRRLWAAGKPQILAEIHRKGLTLAGVEIRFVFGIPAVWGEDAASRMKEAINKSHVLQLPGRLPASVSFIAEPEAAAIAVLPRAVQSGRLKNREIVVICDCGGGTVDVISYEVTSTEPLKVREFVRGEGQILGDRFMRSALEVLIKNRIPGSADNANLDHAALDSEIETIWEAACDAPSHMMDDNRWAHRWRLQHLDGSAGRLVMVSGQDIARVFRTVTDEIVALAKRQVDAVREKGKQTDLIVVLGGFGLNCFLQSELRHYFGERLVEFTGRAGVFAVKDGAATAGMLGNFAAFAARGAEHPSHTHANSVPPLIHIDSRVSRYSYGYRDPNGPIDQVTWFVSEGQDVSVDPTVTFPLPSAAFTTTFHNTPAVIIYHTPLPMPSFSTFSEHDNVTQACQIECEMPEILDRVAEVQVSMQLRGAGMELSVSGQANAFRVVEN